METQSHNLLQLSQNQTIVGAYAGAKDDEQVIITQQSQGIHLYSIFDQKCQRSWIVPPSVSFVCEAILDKEGNYYAAVNQHKSNNNIWSWNSDVLDLVKNTNSVRKTKFDENIFQIFSHKEPGIIVVQEFGSFQVLNSNLQVLVSHNGDRKGASGTVCWANIIFTHKSAHLIIVLELETLYRLQVFQIQSKNSTWTSTLLANQTFMKPTRIPMFTCAYDKYSQTFSVLWSDLSWDVYKVGDLSEGIKAWPQAPKITRNLDTYFSLENKASSKKKKVDLKSNVNQKFASIKFEDGLVLIGGPSKEESQYCITAWDLTYGTLVHTTTVDFNQNDSVPQFVKLFAQAKNKIVTVCLPQKVEVFSISAQPPTLANLIGKAKVDPSNAVLLAPFDLKKELDTALRSEIATAKPDLHLPEAEEHKKLLEPFLDMSSEPADVVKAWKQAKNSVKGVIARLPLWFVNAAAHRNLVDERLHLNITSLLAELMQQKLISARSSSYQLVPSLIKRNAVKLFPTVMEHVEDLSAYDIISMIKHATTTGSDALAKSFKQPVTPTGINNAEQMFFNLVVNHITSHTFMQDAITRLSFPQVMKLLICVHNWLARYAADLGESIIDIEELGIGYLEDNYNVVPSFPSVISWASLLLDTNYVKLMMSAEQVAPYVSNMLACVKVLVQGYEELSNASHMVNYLKQLRRKRKQRHNVYHISILNLEPVALTEIAEKQKKNEKKREFKLKLKKRPSLIVKMKKMKLKKKQNQNQNQDQNTTQNKKVENRDFRKVSINKVTKRLK